MYLSSYEILGSYKSRKRYDQGMVQKSYTNEYSSPTADDPEDDAQTKFYKQHMRRDRPPPPTGSTPIYDFDEWSRQHYGKNFDRRQTAKKRYERIKREEGNSQVRHIEYTVLAMCAFVCFMVVFSKLDQRSYDDVKSGGSNSKEGSTNPAPGDQSK